MKSMHHRRKLGQLAALGLLSVLFVVYLKVGILPGRLKEVATRNLEAVFQQQVEFDRVVYLPFRGISIDGLKTTTLEGERLFTADRLRLQVPLILFLFDKRLIISKAILEKPHFTANAENPDDPSGAQTLHKFLTEGINGFLPDNVYLERLQIRNGTLRVRKSKREPAVIETVERLHLDVNFKHSPNVPVKGAFTLGGGKTRLTFDGKWDLRNISHELHARGVTHEVPAWAARRLRAMGLDARKLTSDFEINLTPTDPYRYAFEARTGVTRGDFSLGGKTLKGSAALNLRGTYDSHLKKAELLGGVIAVQNADITGLPRPVGELRGFKGALRFDANQVHFKDIETGWYGVRTILSGSMMLGASKAFHLEIRQRTENLRFLKKLLPEGGSAGPFDLSDLRGNFSIEAQLDGEADHLEDLRKNIVISVSDTEWTPKDPANATRNITGVITMIDQKIQLNNASFTRGRETYHVNGWLDLEPGSASEINVTHDKFRGEAKLHYFKDRVAVDSVTLTSGLSSVRLSGEAATGGDQGFLLDGKAVLDAGELSKNFASKLPWLRTLKLTGDARFDIRVDGGLRDKKITKAAIKFESDRLRLYDKIPFEKSSADISYRDGRLDVPYGRTTLYHGETRFHGSFDLRKPKHPPFQLAVSARKVDLSEAVPDFKSLDKKFSGILNFDLRLGGILSDRKTYLGSGHLNIKHGMLFTTPLFKRLRNLLFVTIEGIDNLTFNEARMDYTISNGFIHTSDAALSSPLIEVNMNGKIGLDQTLKLMVRSRFSPDVIQESYEIGGLTPLVINYAETKITEYAVTGTLVKPVYTEQK